uniref:indole-3-acetaldehyde oxidase n=2 Tax=Kalanchoe fedtschenkoi TaxID=63787 RepID=A0A7N0USU0_KALFE
MISLGKQLLKSGPDHRPVGEPIIKSESAIQASGEAQYVDDIPSPPYCLHASFVCSTKSLARVKDIKLDSRTQSDEVTTLISYKDIPQSGMNVGYKTLFGTGPLFAEDVTECVGQRLAVVVSETQKKADVAAKLAVVEYDMEGLEPPILTVEQAVERSSFFEIPSFLYPQPVGDILKGMDEADQKIISAEIRLGSQYHFYMETQTALAVPEEDDCMVVYSSIQCPEIAHQAIAKCLGLPEHSIRVITRRVGGGFGGKALKAMPVAISCALAAYKLRRPVRIYHNRKTDMLTTGGRHPMKITYNVGFKSGGKVTALDLNILINAGMDADISPVIPHNMLSTLKKYDWGALSFDIKVCKTNHSSKTAMRAPGEVQGTYIAEAVIENVASHLKMDVDIVRSRNFHTFESLHCFYKECAGEPEELTLHALWDKIAQSSTYYQRTEMIKEFNQLNKWHKRGISRVPVVHQVSVRATPGKVSILSDGSISVEVGGIELGQGLWTKAKQMAAFGLSSIQCEGSTDLLNKVRIVQTDTLSLTQGGWTAGSTTSESSCAAVKLCCDVLVERLIPLKERLEQQMGSITWETLISMAGMHSVNLSASCLYVPDFASMNYLIYGAAVSEVEINILTGETTILQSDIIYDCGKSLNPAVDLGQIEGAFVQGIGFFMTEEYLSGADETVIADGTWNYKIPTVDTIPKKLNVEIVNSGNHKKRVLSSKASGEPPLLLSASIHCATRAAVREARKQLASWSGIDEESATLFNLPVPATMPVVKELCGFDIVERYLETLSTPPTALN